MISVQQAETILLNLVKPLDPSQNTEIVKLEQAWGRILAETVTSNLDFPHWDNSAMDGYAVNYEDVKNCNSNNPIILNIVEEIPAGYQPKISLQKGQAARIFTGAVIPQGADTIVIQENTKREGKKVTILTAPQPQEFIRYQGAFYQAGKPLLNTGIKLNPPEIAILAAAQLPKVKVYRRPKIAIFSTGDELVTPDQILKLGQIVDSNQYALAAFIRQQGASPLLLGIIPDNRQVLKAIIESAINQADLVLSTGGVSVGDYDYIEEILGELGGKIEIESVAIKPGKPLTVANFADKALYIGIPGNPVSALVSCWRFVQPVIKKLSGLNGNFLPQFIKGKTNQKLVSDGKRETYLWGNLQLIDGVYWFNLAGGSHSSGNLINLAQTNALAVIPVGVNLINEGELIEIMITDHAISV
jgi:molybdopterin molybdotransferase